MIECRCTHGNCPDDIRLYVQDDIISLHWAVQPGRLETGSKMMYVNEDTLKQLIRDAVDALKKRLHDRATADLFLNGLE